MSKFVYTNLQKNPYLCPTKPGMLMYTVETREFRANLADMLKKAENTPVLLDRGRKGLILFAVALNPLKSLANASNVLHARDFRENMASYLDMAGDKLMFIRNSEKVLLQITAVPEQYEEGVRRDGRILKALEDRGVFDNL